MSNALIEELFGHALKSLADTGADAVAMGKFALDFQTKIAPLLADKLQADVSLEEIIQSTVLRTLEVSSTHGVVHTPTHTDVHSLSVSRRSGQMEFERVSITVNGKRTNVTLEKRLHATIAAMSGGSRKANKLIRRAATALGGTQEWDNPSMNKSAYLSHYLRTHVLEQFDVSQQVKQ